MKIGDLVIYRDKLYRLLGLDPMSLDDRRAQIEDPDTGEVLHVPVEEVRAREV